MNSLPLFVWNIDSVSVGPIQRLKDKLISLNEVYVFIRCRWDGLLSYLACMLKMSLRI